MNRNNIISYGSSLPLCFFHGFFLFTLLVTLTSGLCLSATYYVNPVNGIDSNSGLSTSLAWKTFNRAIETYSGSGNKVTKGDTVILMPGQYGACTINYTPPVASQNWSQKITYQAQVSRTAVFTSATTDTMTVMGDFNRYLEFNGIQFASTYAGVLSTPFKLETSSYIRLVNCEFVGTWDDGTDQASFLKTTEVGIRITRALGVNSLMQGIVIENCEIHQVRQGILILAALGLNDPEGDSVFKIKNCLIHTTARSPIDFRETTHTYKPINSEVDPPNASLMHGTIILEGNHIYNQQAKNADGAGDWTHGSGMALATNNLIIRNNIIHSVGSTAGIGLYDPDAPGYLPHVYYEDIFIENNLIYDTISSHALELSNIGSGRVVVKNNTIIGFYDVGTDWKRYGAVVWIYPTSGHTGTGLEFFNNIVVGSVIMYTGFEFADGKEDYNQIYSVWDVGATPAYPTRLKGNNTVIYCPGTNTNIFESGFFPNPNYSRGTDFVRYPTQGGPNRLMLNNGYTSPLAGIGYTAGATGTDYYTLSVSSTNGTVTKSPNKTSYTSGETVSLSVAANTGYSFSSWTGDAAGSASPVTITMNANKSVTANFIQLITNDNFANAAAISGYSGQTTGSSTGATKETGEPSHAGFAGGSSLWWYWTAPSSGQMTINTFNSNFDTLLAAYTGSAVGSLTAIASNDDSSSSVRQSQVTFSVVSGTTYRIAVDGYNLQNGSIVLNWSLTTSTTTYTLSVTTANGTVTKSPDKTAYTSGESVTLTAAANTGYSFGSWSGDATGTTNPVTVTMNANKTVTANFTQNTYTLSATAANGTVAKSPNTATYTYGQVVTLTATANTGYSFGSWSGDATGTTNPVTITMNGNKAVTANFTTQNTYTLTVTAANGTVAKSPNTATYTYGQVVTLTATASAGYSFGSWTGDATGTTSPVSVTINGNKAVTANFTALSMTESMTAHWMLDENTGSSGTDTVAGRTASLINSPLWGFAWANEDWVSMANQTQAISIPASALQPYAGSIAVWVEPDSTTGTQFIFGHVFNSSNRISMYSVAGKLALGLGANAALQTNIADLTAGQTVHIALTWSGTSYAVYVNAVQKITGTFEGLTALNTTMDIGNYGDPANRTVGFVGVIEDIRTYCRALTATEIQRLYYTYDVYQQKTLVFTLPTTDTLGQPISYQSVNLPVGAIYQSGTFTWQPSYNQTGSYTIAFVASGQPVRIVTIFVHETSLAEWYRQFLVYSEKL